MVKQRFEHLDGLRGIMALNVVFNHFIVVFFPEIFLFAVGENIFNSTPIQSLYNGSIAVSYFFILSGFLTSYGVLKSKKLSFTSIVTKTAKRYFRLIPMVFVSIFLTYILMEFDLLYHLQTNRELLTLYCNFEPSLFGALKDVFVDTFLTSSKYVGPFWFIKFDFFGYIITLFSLYVIVKFEKMYKFRRIIMLIFVLVYSYVSVQLTAFSFGILLADFYVGDNTFISKHYNLKNKWMLILMGVVGVCLVTIPTKFVGIWKLLEPISLFPHTMFWCGFGWFLCLWVLFNCEKVKCFLSKKIFVFLGKISFPMYSIHWVCMLSIQDYLFCKFRNTLSYTESALLSFLIVLPIILSLAYFLWFTLERKKPVDIVLNKISIKKKIT